MLDTVSKFRQGGAFPEPTESELLKLVKNMGLTLIIESMISNSSMQNSSEFKERLEKEKKYLLIKDYVEKNVNPEQPSNDDIKKFYQDNLKTLFSFKMDNGKVEIQKMDEVKDFIIQKLNSKNMQEARYALYRNLVNDDHYKIDDKKVELFKKEIIK